MRIRSRLGLERRLSGMQGKNGHVNNREKEGEGTSINLDLPGLPSFVAAAAFAAARDCALVLGGREIRGFQCNGSNVRVCARVVEVEDYFLCLALPWPC